MEIDLTWTITAIIAVSSFASSVAVALINNKQQQKMHQMDLDYDKSVAELRVKCALLKKLVTLHVPPLTYKITLIYFQLAAMLFSFTQMKPIIFYLNLLPM